MQMMYLAAALAFQTSGLLPASGNDANSYAEAYRCAQRSDRPLLVVLEDRHDATGHLRSLATEESLRLSTEYQVCRIDVNTSYGAEVARSYQADKFPYSVVTDRRGEIIYRGIGQGQSAAGFGRRQPAKVARRSADHPTEPAVQASTAIAADAAPSTTPVDAVFAVTDLEAAQQRARQQNRMLVAFVTTTSCHYCLKMKREALQNPTVRETVSEHFVSARIDGDLHAAWAERHGIRMYPTVLVLTSHGHLVDRIEGYVSADQLTARLDQATSQLLSQR